MTSVSQVFPVSQSINTLKPDQQFSTKGKQKGEDEHYLERAKSSLAASLRASKKGEAGRCAQRANLTVSGDVPR